MQKGAEVVVYYCTVRKSASLRIRIMRLIELDSLAIFFYGLLGAIVVVENAQIIIGIGELWIFPDCFLIIFLLFFW